MSKLRYIQLAILVFLFSPAAFAGTTFKATTTLTAETSNNTSAANTFTAQSNGNAGAGNISKAPLRSLLYPGSTAKIYAHFMPWFGFGDHMNIGYTSSDPTQVQKQISDMVSRGLDGTIIDWYGRGTMNHNFSYYDQAVQYLRQQAELHPGFNFAIMHDAGAIQACANTSGCDITQMTIDDLNYAYNTYENSPAYLHFNGQPVVYFFGHEAYPIDWNRVRASVMGNPMFIFRNAGGFQQPQSNGGFSWMAPESVSAGDPMSLAYLDYYDKIALSLAPAYSSASAYKGFNDSLALWGSGRLVGQQCGQTWLQSIAESAKFYSTSKQMPSIQLVTWNDYEEGTEFETGIENCVTIAASVSGTVVSWSITGQANTVDHYTVFMSQDGQNLMPLADISSGISSLDVLPFGLSGAKYTVFVKAVGKPSMTNKMSAGIQMTVASRMAPPAFLGPPTLAGTPAAPTSQPVAALNMPAGSTISPAPVATSASASTGTGGTTVRRIANLGGDSANANRASATHIYSSPGVYTAMTAVTDNPGVAVSTAETPTKTLQVPRVVVSAPASVAASGPLVHVVASGFSRDLVVAMQIYVDGALVYDTSQASLDTTVKMSPGRHEVAVKGWDIEGRNFMQVLKVIVSK
ncbi:MAG TPA: hypothetical protein VN176_08310 [Verrucomicrobiae bacterium]|jgi:hypothetical protein|nr:hypothetical protein [Verrucomicrobiae bacterium]